MRVLVTGGIGFIGTHLCRALLDRGDEVVVLDNLDPFYDVAIKLSNLDALRAEGGDRLRLIEGDIREPSHCREALSGVRGVIHLAALAGVRPSIQEPARYMDVNVRGTQILMDAVQQEVARQGQAFPFIFGSSSSVYGGNKKVPFAEDDPVDGPVSPYAASKRAGELICHTFQHLTGIPVSCMRFFTVYGPGQRPEMAIHKFTRKIFRGESLPFFGDGTSSRDYTYVSDIVQGLLAALERAEGYRIYNLGGSDTVTLKRLVETLGEVIGKEPILDPLPDQPGDVPTTNADIHRAEQELGYRREVRLESGLRAFVDWYREARTAGRIS